MKFQLRKKDEISPVQSHLSFVIWIVLKYLSQRAKYDWQAFFWEVNSSEHRHKYRLSQMWKKRMRDLSRADTTVISAMEDQIAKEALEINSMPRARVLI